MFPKQSLVFESPDGKGYSSTLPPTVVGQYRAVLTADANQAYSGTRSGEFAIMEKKAPEKVPVSVGGLSVADATYDGQVSDVHRTPATNGQGWGKVVPTPSKSSKSTDGQGYSSTLTPQEGRK